MESIREIIEEIQETDRKIAQLQGQRLKLMNRREYLEARAMASGKTKANAASSGKLWSLRIARNVLSEADGPLRTAELIAGLKRQDPDERDRKESTLRSHLLRLRREGALNYNKEKREWFLDVTTKE